MKQRLTKPIKTIAVVFLLSWLLLAAYANTPPTSVSAAPLLQTSCTLPATVTTASQLSNCITTANAGSGGTITLGADITLTSALPQIATAITLEGANHVIDGGSTVRIFSVASTGNFTINRATLKNGHAVDGGGLSNAGFLVITESTLTDNDAAAAGGAIYNGSGALVAVANSTISGNSALSGGGGIYSAGTTLLFNSTVSGNEAGGAGGGISLTSPSVLTASGTTFYGNTASAGGSQAAVFANSGTTVHLAGNLFAGGSNCDIRGTFNDKGYNLSDDATCTNGATGSATNVTLNLGALADNGGSTLTHLPGAGSAAIGAIPNGTAINNNTLPMSCNNTTTDQLGSRRPLSAGINCTSGAVEVAPTVTSLTIIKDASPAIGTDFDFTINSAPLTSYSDTTIGKPFWTRPNEGTTCTLSANSVRYHVQAFVVDTSGSYSMVSIQNYNGYLHLYQDSFNPLDQCANYLKGDDNSGLGSNQSELSYSLEAGRVYYLVTSGFASASTGTFTNNIARDGGGGVVYTLYESFTLDDAVPDDSDGVNASITYAVPPGTYSVSELLVDSAWGLDSATCTGASGGFSLTDETLAVAIALGETVSCTFTNVTTVDCGNIMSESDLSFCIADANANGAGLDTLTLGADITLSTALPQITSEITLQGAGYAIDGTNSVRIFYVAASGDFTVHQTTLQRGRADYGAGIYNASTLTVTDSTFSGNRAANGGGGIFSLDTLRVTNSTFSGNSVTELVKSGGGISNNNGTLTVTNSTFSNNRAYSGGGISNNNGVLTVTNSTFSVNSADTGGGIFNDGTLTMSNSTFFGNSSDDRDRGGGILNADTAYLAGNVFAAGLSGDNCVNTGTLNDNGYNLSDDASCGFSGTGSVNNATLNLSALSVTTTPGQQVHTPQAGSDAIGVIPNGTTINNNGVTLACNQTTTDQLGADRPITALAACTAGAVEVEPPSLCTSWTVTTADELSACITLANNNESPSPTADTITLGADINLSTALPQITSEITLEGANHVIDGGWDGVPGSPTGRRIFTVNLGGDLTIKDTILQNGSAREGGGISNNGRLTVMNSTISSNYAYSPIGNAYAGGIFNNGTLAVTNSTISGNSAINGAGIGNSGTLTVTNSTFSGNSAYFDGGGIFNSGTLTVMNSTFVGNEAQYNWGGGINNYGTLRVTNSTFSGNSATYGGGIYNYRGGLTATNSTFSGNDAINGGGIYNSSTAYLAGNVFAAGQNGDNCGNSGGTFNDNGYNLSDDGSCGFSSTGSADNATLNLSALSVTTTPGQQVHTPQVGSDAIGAIPNGTTISNNGTDWTCDQSATDQRGELRPLNSGDACTAGAVEVEPPPICTSWTVTTAAELSACITLANNNEGPSPTADTITLGADITLNTALPQISSEITLEGAGYAIDGGNRVQLFYVASTGDFTVNQVTLQNGEATDGGGVENYGTLTVTDSTFSGNRATTGGGISNWRGTVTVTNSTFSGNTADYGGGIGNSRGTVTVTNSTFSGNSATNGGGIVNGIRSTLRVTNSTFSGNTATKGGGIQSAGVVTVTNSTFSGNSAPTGGGIGNTGTVRLAGTIFAAGLNGDNCAGIGTINDNGYNLSDDASCGFSGTGSANNATLALGALADNGGPTQTHLPGVGSDAIGAIPNGTTISNNGTSWTCDQSATDQRGELRPINAGTACTAGAVEVARVQLTMQPNGYFSWLPTPSGSCSESLYRSSTPYVGHTWLTDDPANYDGSGSLTSVAVNYFYYLLVDCGGSQSQSNEVGEFTFAIVPGS